MTPSPGSLLSRVLHGWCAGAAALCALVGLVVLIAGWALGVEALAVMKRSTALCFALAGAALWVLGEQPASGRVRVLADAPPPWSPSSRPPPSADTWRDWTRSGAWRR